MRIQSRAAATILGVSQRTVQSLAMSGELPGAAGIGGTWTFNSEKLTASVEQRQRDAENVVVSISERRGRSRVRRRPRSAPPIPR